MKNKIKIIIGIVIVAILIIAILIMIFWPKNQGNSYNKKEIIEKISNGFVEGISQEELEKLMNQQIADKTMMTGKDAYLLKKPNNDEIKKYELNEYVKNNETYFNNLVQKIKENFSWEFADKAGKINYYVINVKTYSYGVYLSDLEEMVNQLISRVSNNIPKNINQYKAKVIAMKVLNNHLGEYIYKGDTRSVIIDFKGINQNDTKNSLMQYLIDLAGYNNQSDENISAMEQNRQSRIKTYIDNAINDGTLDKNDVLKL